MFKCLPFIRGCGGHIEYIEKRHASLLSVPDEVIRSYRTLEECKLDANQIKELPSAFFKLEKIRVLTVSDNELTSIPPEIGNFANLVELDISRNDICVIPSSMRFCDALQFLNASNNSLKTLPDGFSQLRSLRILNLNDVSLFELPQDFGLLKKLQKLELRDNCLSCLPSSFGELTNLEFLDLGGNDFVELPASIGNLHSLLELWLDDNQLNSLPDDLGNLHALQQMDASENHLTSLPSTISGLTSLTDLNLTQNYLDSLPEEIGDLNKLTVFKLNHNQLVDLTAAIGKCDGLLELYLTENYLSVLPSTIGNLTKMFHFNASKNQLVDLPTEIGKCVTLQILAVRDNNLRRIPNEIGSCTLLSVLDLAGNRIDRLPISLTSCPLKALWLIQSQAQSQATLQKAVDEATGEEYLTCYLLPQDFDDGENGPTNSLSSPGATSNQFKKELESANGTLLPAQVASSTSSIVNLDGEKDGGEEGLEEAHYDVETKTSSSARVHFTQEDDGNKNHSDAAVSRDYPKTRHPMYLKKSSDADITHKKSDPYPPFLPSAVLDLQPNSNDQNDIHGQLQKNGPLNGNRHSEVQGNTSLPTYIRRPREEEQEGDGKRVAPSANSDSPRLYTRGTNAHALRVGSADLSDVASVVSTGSSGAGYNLPYENTSSSRQQKRLGSGAVAFALSSPGEIHEVGNAERRNGDNTKQADEEQAYSSGGEEIDTITKSVVFSDEVLDNEDNSNQKLIRRDTPHYTKRARIHNKNSDSGSNEETVLRLLKKYHDPYVADSFADRAAPENVKTSPGERPSLLQTANALLMVAAAAAATSPTHGRSPNAAPPIPTSPSSPRGATFSGDLAALPREQVTMHITLLRDPGGGLGLSIAGGVGSVPYRGLDQGIFVSRLAPGGLADTCGLKVGDKILEVNGVSLVNADHQAAVSALRNDATRFRLLLARELPVLAPDRAGNTDSTSAPLDDHPGLRSSVSPRAVPPIGFGGEEPNTTCKLSSSLLNSTSLGRASMLPLHTQAATQVIKCTLNRDWSGLGFSIAGGRGLLSTQSDAATIYISRVVEGGAADKSGHLRVGDLLLKINGIDVRNARHDQVITLLTGAGPNMVLEVLRKLPPPQTSVSDASVSPSAVEFIAGSPSSPSMEHEGPEFLGHDNGCVVDRINLHHRHGKHIGFSICGGTDTSCLPFGVDNPGIFVCRVEEDGEAMEAGLRVGDRLLRVNGRDIQGLAHDEAVTALMPPTSYHSSADARGLVLEVRRDPLPPGLRELVIPCPADEHLGMNLISLRLPSPPPVTGQSASAGKPEEGIFVGHISSGGILARDGRVKPGDRLVVANSEWLMDLELQEVAEIVQPRGGALRLTLCDGVDPSAFFFMTNAAGGPATARQEVFYTNIHCHLIDCDGKPEERVKPVNKCLDDLKECVHPFVEIRTAFGLRDLTVRLHVPFDVPEAQQASQPRTFLNTITSEESAQVFVDNDVDVRLEEGGSERTTSVPSFAAGSLESQLASSTQDVGVVEEGDGEEVLVHWKLAPAPSPPQRGATPVLVDPSHAEVTVDAVSCFSEIPVEFEASADIESIVSENRSIPECRSRDISIIGASKKRFITPNLLEKMRRWQAERDRAEGVVRQFTFAAKPPRFPVRPSTNCSSISERSFTLTRDIHVPLDGHIVGPTDACLTPCPAESLFNLSQQVRCQEVNCEDSEQKADKEEELTEHIFTPMFFETQINPVLCGASMEKPVLSITTNSKCAEMLPCSEDERSRSCVKADNEGKDSRKYTTPLIDVGLKTPARIAASEATEAPSSVTESHQQRLSPALPSFKDRLRFFEKPTMV